MKKESAADDRYYINLKEISLKEYSTELLESELIPSRRILQEDTKKRFDILVSLGFSNLDELLCAMKTAQKIQDLSRKSGLSEEFLVILRREISSDMPKPVKLKEFAGVSSANVQKLAKAGILDTRDLFPFVVRKNARNAFSREKGIPFDDILELARLTDLCRIKWVGANFARLLADSEANTVVKVARADYKKLYLSVVRINEEKKYFKGKFGENDMKLCVLAAQKVPDAIEY